MPTALKSLDLLRCLRCLLDLLPNRVASRQRKPTRVRIPSPTHFWAYQSGQMFSTPSYNYSLWSGDMSMLLTESTLWYRTGRNPVHAS